MDARRFEGRLVALAAILLLASSARADRELRRLPLRDGTTLRYAELLPPDYRSDRAYPVLLALPPGDQSAAMVERAVALYWQSLAQHGWIVVSPATPDGRLFFQGAESVLPELMDHVLAAFRVEGGRLHLAGVSNGGRSAFHLAVASPSRFASLTVLPGFPPSAGDFAKLDRLRGLPVALFGGSLDPGWVAQMRRTRARLESLGADVHLTVYPGEGHVPASLAGGAVLLRTLEARRGRTAEGASPHPPPGVRGSSQP